MLNLTTNAGSSPATPANRLTLGPIDFEAISSDARDTFVPRGFGAWHPDVRAFVGQRVILTVHYAETVDERGEGLLPRIAIVPAQAAATGSYLIPGNVHADGTRDPDEPGFPIVFSDVAEDPGHEPDSLWGDADA